jgi:exodeoxyribonuclease VII large subunit
LHTEGLFDEKYKKPLPSFPKQIALITSPTGAVIEDMKKIICSRNNFVDILIYPVLVQGAGAAEQIKGGIEYINSVYPETDIIIIGRGGGSTEDLWAFNEEVLARAVFASEIPLISAVGHESDVTISDYVADVRAETPTAAATLAVPDIDEIQEWLDETFDHLVRNMGRLIEINRRKLADKNIDMLTQSVLQKIASLDAKTDKVFAECGNVLRYNISQLNQRVDNAGSILKAMDPHSIMKRGYAELLKEDGTPVVSVDAISEGDLLRAVLYDGEAKLEVKDMDPASSAGAD